MFPSTCEKAALALLSERLLSDCDVTAGHVRIWAKVLLIRSTVEPSQEALIGVLLSPVTSEQD